MEEPAAERPRDVLHQEQVWLNVRNYGAAGAKSQDATPAIQKALNECAARGGGTVYLPPGEYTSATLHLRSHVRVYLDAGATLFATTNPASYEKASLFYGEDLEDIALEGRGTVDGQSEYIWQLDTLDDAYIRPNKLEMQALGKPLMRAFPKGFPQRSLYPHMVLLLRCRDVRIGGLSILHSPSWTINLYACERLVIDGVYIHTSLKEGVWADGIDPDGCKDVRIMNSTIATGDDAIVFYSTNAWGPVRPCENITITNCRLSSASSAIKFCDGNQWAVRNVTISNCVITDSNRGIAFMIFDGGYVSDVVISNITIQTRRFDWFWWGDGDPIHFNIKRRSEVDGIHRDHEPPAGSIRNVILSDIVAHGQGTCFVNGHPDSWLDDVSLENIQLFLSTDPAAPYDKSIDAMKIRWAKNLKLKNFEVTWDQPELKKWRSALSLQDIQNLQIDGFSGRQAPPQPDAPAILLENVEQAMIRNSVAQPGSRTFLEVKEPGSRDVCLLGNDLRHAEQAYQMDLDLRNEVHELSNLLPMKPAIETAR